MKKLYSITLVAILGLSFCSINTLVADARPKHSMGGPPDDPGFWSRREMKPWKRMKNNNKPAINAFTRKDDYKFTTHQQRLLRKLFNDDNDILSDRLRADILGQQQLPPGIAKNLHRGKPIPPGIARQMNNLPPNAYGYLGLPYSNDYRVGTVGRNVILYNTATNVIRDLLRNAF